jgi:hypothetical protein
MFISGESRIWIERDKARLASPWAQHTRVTSKPIAITSHRCHEAEIVIVNLRRAVQLAVFCGRLNRSQYRRRRMLVFLGSIGISLRLV